MGIICGLLCVAIAIPLGLMIGAVILRAAVSISNKILGPSRSSRYTYVYEDDDDDYDYRPRRRRSNSSGAIPEPGIGQGMLIVFLAWLVNAGLSFGITLALAGGAEPRFGPGADRGAQLVANLVSLPVSFLVLAAMCTAMLPTSFGRACLVALFYWLICILIAVVIVAIIMVVGFAALGMGK